MICLVVRMFISATPQGLPLYDMFGGENVYLPHPATPQGLPLYDMFGGENVYPCHSTRTTTV